MVHQAALALHVVGLLLLDGAKVLAGQENLRRVVDVDMNPHPLLPASHDQRTAVELLQAGHHGLAVDMFALQNALGAVPMPADVEFLQRAGQVGFEIGAELPAQPGHGL